LRLKVEGGELRGKNPNTWTQNDFTTKMERLNGLTRQLQSMTQDLAGFTIPRTDWLAALFTPPPQPQMSSRLHDALNPHPPGDASTDTPLPSR
jgi:hypothetical protein